MSEIEVRWLTDSGDAQGSYKVETAMNLASL